jgi:hypothetical protein
MHRTLPGPWVVGVEPPGAIDHEFVGVHAWSKIDRELPFVAIRTVMQGDGVVVAILKFAV